MIPADFIPMNSNILEKNTTKVYLEPICQTTKMERLAKKIDGFYRRYFY